MDVIDIALVAGVADRSALLRHKLGKPMIELSGVRTSWLTFARNSSRDEASASLTGSIGGLAPFTGCGSAPFAGAAAGSCSDSSGRSGVTV